MSLSRLGLSLGLGGGTSATSSGGGGGGAAAANPLLDDYGSAKIGYSLRHLNSSYSGNCIKVRLTSGPNTWFYEAGFSSGVLDTAGVEAFVASNAAGSDAFVHTWYDQSGNGINATQAEGIYQPKIVDSGSVVTLNGKPSMDFDGTDDHLDIGSEVFGNTNLGTGNMSFWGVASLDSATTATNNPFTLIGEGTSATTNTYFLSYGDKFGAVGDGSTANLYRVSTSGSVGPQVKDTQLNLISHTSQFILGYTWDGTTHRLSSNDNSVVTDTTTPNPYAGYANNSIGCASSKVGSEMWDGKVAELVQWHSSQESNRAGIFSNINGFYGAY